MTDRLRDALVEAGLPRSLPIRHRSGLPMAVRPGWAYAAAGVLIATAAGCLLWRWFSARALLAHAMAGGLMPFGTFDTAPAVLWTDHPGHLLHIVGLPIAGAGLTVFVSVIAIWLALMCVALRGTLAPFLMAALGIGACLLLMGAFLPQGDPVFDLVVDRDAGVVRKGALALPLCDMTELRVDARHGSRGGAYYVLAATLPAGPLDLAVVADHALAGALQAEMAKALAAGACPHA